MKPNILTALSLILVATTATSASAERRFNRDALPAGDTWTCEAGGSCDRDPAWCAGDCTTLDHAYAYSVDDAVFAFDSKAACKASRAEDPEAGAASSCTRVGARKPPRFYCMAIDVELGSAASLSMCMRSREMCEAAADSVEDQLHGLGHVGPCAPQEVAWATEHLGMELLLGSSQSCELLRATRGVGACKKVR